MAADVFGAHIDVAGESEDGGGGGGGDAVLAGAGFGDDAFFAHAEGEECLAEGVVDFVGAGVVEVFAFEVDFGAAEGFGESAGEIEGIGSAGELAEIIVEIAGEGWIGFGFGVMVLELFEGGDESFGDIDAAVGAEMAGGIGESCRGSGHRGNGREGGAGPQLTRMLGDCLIG